MVEGPAAMYILSNISLQHRNFTWSKNLGWGAKFALMYQGLHGYLALQGPGLAESLGYS